MYRVGETFVTSVFGCFAAPANLGNYAYNPDFEADQVLAGTAVTWQSFTGSDDDGAFDEAELA